jgi:hypothetical protein
MQNAKFVLETINGENYNFTEFGTKFNVNVEIVNNPDVEASKQLE